LEPAEQERIAKYWIQEYGEPIDCDSLADAAHLTVTTHFKLRLETARAASQMQPATVPVRPTCAIIAGEQSYA
jgi:hypothetical protein